MFSVEGGYGFRADELVFGETLSVFSFSSPATFNIDEDDLQVIDYEMVEVIDYENVGMKQAPEPVMVAPPVNRRSAGLPKSTRRNLRRRATKHALQAARGQRDAANSEVPTI